MQKSVVVPLFAALSQSHTKGAVEPFRHVKKEDMKTTRCHKDRQFCGVALITPTKRRKTDIPIAAAMGYSSELCVHRHHI